MRDIVKRRGPFGAGEWGMEDFRTWYKQRGKTGWTQP